MSSAAPKLEHHLDKHFDAGTVPAQPHAHRALTPEERAIFEAPIDEAAIARLAAEIAALPADAQEMINGEEDGVILSPEDEAELAERIAETDKNFRAGRCIPWEQLAAERGLHLTRR